MWSRGAEPGRRVGRSWSSPGEPLIGDLKEKSLFLMLDGTVLSELSSAAVQEF